VDEQAKEDLAAFLGSLGFRHAGRHRSKSVELYRQGRVNLVLNSEPDSAASEHFQMHGPSVCAMALRVDDADKAVDRAEALLYGTWRERIGEASAASSRFGRLTARWYIWFSGRVRP
jgi:4-hydroxyphenylpyruvate dioxygenase